MPDGHVIFTAGVSFYSRSENKFVFSIPTVLFDYSPRTNTIAQVKTPCSLTQVLDSTTAGVLRMLVLPSGQLLLSDGTKLPWVYTPRGSPQPSWRPTIRRVTSNGNGTFTLVGTGINGLSEGAAFGDDAQMASNYPLVRLTRTQTCAVSYARTFNWSSTGVATGKKTETTDFSLPRLLSPGVYRLAVKANGISSVPIRFRVK